MAASTVVLLKFVLMLQACPFAKQVEQFIFLEMSPVERQFHQAFPQYASSVCSLPL
jgi:hypothetical protein